MHRGGRNPRAAAPRNNYQTSDYTTIRVRGWQQSKAASNPDGGVESVLEFLEKKASGNRGPKLETFDPYVNRDTLEVSVRADTADRFLHLNGFTFAGVQLIVEQKGSTTRSAPPNNALENRMSAPVAPRQNSTSRPLQAVQNNGPQRHTRSQMSVDDRNGNSAAICDLTPKAPVFKDQGDVAKSFIAAFFPLYDSDREAAIRNFYDDQSTFSLSATTHKRRSASERSQTNLAEYIRLSRNLKRITHPPARAARKSAGQKAIFDVWNVLPKTQHPPLADSASWLFECCPIHNLQHPTEPTTVSGLTINIHGCFQDLDKNNQVDTKSFDRVFILGPGGGVGGIRVISDALVLRPFYLGNKALENANTAPPAPAMAASIDPQAQPQLAPPIPTASPIPPHPEVPDGSGYGQPLPGKSEEQVKKEQMKLELSFNTKMKLQFAEDALASNNWDFAAALATFKSMHEKGAIPPDVFLVGV